MIRHTHRSSDHREISCRSINTILAYAKEQGKDVAGLIAGLPYDESYLTDTDHWIPSRTALEIYRRLRWLFDDDEVMFKVGLASERLRTLGFLDHIVRLMGSPQFIIRQAPALNRYFNRTDAVEVVNCTASSAIIKYSASPGYELSLDDCYYTQGIFAAIPGVFNAGPARIWEETCAVPIHRKGRINGKRYTVDEQGNVFEHDTADSGIAPRMIGRTNPDGTFKLNNTTYGAKHCCYHLTWPGRRMFFLRLWYALCTRPQVTNAAIEEFQRQNDQIQLNYQRLYETSFELQRHYVDTISALVKAIDAKDHYTRNHSLKVSRIAEIIAKEMGLPAYKIDQIMQACKLHDLGKIGISDSVLQKNGPLTPEEWEEIKRHPALGAEIIKPLGFLTEVAMLVRQDHERWDGAGYPDGLKGEEIDIGARVIALADAYDAMASGRAYKRPFAKKDVAEKIQQSSGSQFDPAVVDAFLRVLARHQNNHPIPDND